MAEVARRQTGLIPAGRAPLRALLLVGVPAILTAAALLLPYPALDAFVADPSGTRITDRDGTLLSTVPSGNGELVEKRSREDLPGVCREIFVRLEDARFAWHPGVDLPAAARALFLRALGRGPRSGASTITMQLARIVSPRPRNAAGKVLEVLQAFRIEARIPKDEILRLYLDSVPFGRNTRGVGAAAWTYFGADLATLAPAQLLALAVIPRNPTAYDPFDHPLVLAAEAGRLSARKGLGIDPEEIAHAVGAARSARPPVRAPHFTRAVARKLLEGSLQAPEGQARTSLDIGLNDFIERRVRFFLDRYTSARVTNAAVVVIENADGSIRGWVGSRDFQDARNSGQLDGVRIERQSASTLKPFLYALALQSGWTAATLLPDAPLEFGAGDGAEDGAPAQAGTYRPVNFDRRSRGVVRLRTALASSLNVPAVYLLSRLGVPRFLSTLEDLGFSLPSDAVDRFGPGAAVGNVEISLLELARAFSSFPRGGSLPDLRYLESAAPAGRGVWDPATAWMICDILSDPSARSSGFGTRTYFATPFPAMFKSGTSSEFTDLWCVGATPLYTVAVWAGNFDGRAVINKTGSVLPAQVAAEVLARLTREPRGFAAPPGMGEVDVCSLTGGRASPSCPAIRGEFFRDAAALPSPCVFHASGSSPTIARDALLLESLLGPGEGLRILFPVAGQVFYLDETVRAATQGIPVVVASRQEGRLSLTLDGTEVFRGSPLGSISVPARRGAHSVVAREGDLEEAVSFEVR